MITPWVALLRKAVEQRTHIISSHARIRMGERNVSEVDVSDCCLYGQVIEEQDHGRDVKVLLQGVDTNGEAFFIVVALKYPRPVIVTVSRFLDDTWGDLGQFKKRR